VKIIKRTVAITEGGMRLDRWLQYHFPWLSFVHVQKLIRTGQVRVNSKRVPPSTRLTAGVEIRLPLFEEPKATPPFSKPIPKVHTRDLHQFQKAIIFEDEHYIAINKPQGIAVQGGTGTVHHLALILKALWPDPATCPKIVHRLDRDTSGVLVFAKNLAAARWLAQAFRQHKVNKYYRAIIVGTLPATEGLIDAPIAKRRGVQKEKMSVSPGGDTAQTSYHLLKKAAHDPLSYIAFQPLTGRTHQIRVHTASMGCPILGDGKYGGKKAHPLPKRTPLCLHAAELSFKGETGNLYRFTAPLPEHFQDILETYFV
jgi:23S rRNA pseudouridine955/2504/2580 synthase